MVVIEALFGAAQAFFQPAYTGLLPQTVPEELIQEARALTEIDGEPRVPARPGARDGARARPRRGRGVRVRRGDVRAQRALLVRVRPRRADAAAAPAHGQSVLDELRAGWREVRSRPGCG